MEDHRGVVQGTRRPSGGALTLIVWRESGGVVRCHEGAARITARLTAGDAAHLAELLLAAAGARPR